MFKKISVILIIFLGATFNVSAKIIDVFAPHQFQPGEEASAVKFNENMNNVYAAASDDQQVLGLNDNVVIARDSISDALALAVTKKPSPDNIIKIILNSNKIYNLDSSITIPSYVVLVSGLADFYGEAGSTIKLNNNAQIILQSNSKLRGVNVVENSNITPILVNGTNVKFINSSINQLGAAPAIKFDNSPVGNTTQLVDLVFSLVKNNSPQSNPTFAFDSNKQAQIILHSSIIENQAGFLSNNNLVSFNAIGSEINTNVTAANLNAIFSYQKSVDGNMRVLTNKN